MVIELRQDNVLAVVAVLGELRAIITLDIPVKHCGKVVDVSGVWIGLPQSGKASPDRDPIHQFKCSLTIAGRQIFPLVGLVGTLGHLDLYWPWGGAGFHQGILEADVGIDPSGAVSGTCGVVVHIDDLCSRRKRNRTDNRYHQNSQFHFTPLFSVKPSAGSCLYFF